ncbi:MAG: hypothetical protein IJ460_07000 [Clostridia bacterium]|nr:hypothetical protein [Clostridia bacterium]
MKFKGKIAMLLALMMVLQCAFAVTSFGEETASTLVDPGKSTGKTAYAAKTDNKIVDLFDFETDKGTEIGNMYITGDINSVTAEKLSDGTYIRYKTDAGGSGVNTKLFGTAVGGRVQVDFQFALFDSQSAFNLYTYPTARGDYIMNTISVGNGRLNATSGGAPIQIMELKTGKWYNVSMYYDFDDHSYSVAVDGKMIKENLILSQMTGTIQSYDIDVSKNQTVDFGFDSLRVSYWGANEKPKGTVTEKRDPNVLYKHDFEGSTGNIATGSAGSVDYVTENGNTFIRAARVTKSGSCTTDYGFAKTTGDVSVEFDFRLGDLTESTKVFYLSSGMGFHVPLYFDFNMVRLNMSDSDRPVVYEGLEANKWYNMAIHTDLAAQSYTFYLDGKKIGGDDYKMTSSPATEFTKVRVAVTWGEAGVFDVDNLVIKKLNENVDVVSATLDNITGYNPDNDAPALNEWVKNSYTEPTGELYEAEEMKLEEYKAVKDSVFHNGTGIAASEAGYGAATFTYNGESGYKGIDIAYSEADGVYDSRFYLYQNGELIDWWLGQHDAKALYVRESKDYWYVEKGDTFMLRGAYGEDPSYIDYVEFTEGTKREFTHGELIAEERLQPSYWNATSWDMVEDAGWARNGVAMKDVKTDASNELIRRITPISCNFTAEFQLTAYSDSYFDFVAGSLRGGYPVKVTFNGADIQCGGLSSENIIANNKAANVKIEVSQKNKTYNVYVDGMLIANNVAFDGDTEEFDVVKLVSSKEGKADFRAYPFLLHAGYVLNENFRNYPENGTDLIGWTANGRNRGYKSSGQRSDPNSREILQNSSISKNFDAQTGIITYENTIMFPAKKDGVRIELGNADAKIALFTKGDSVWYDDGKGGTGIVWENYRRNVWYVAKMVVDPAQGKAEFSINDFAKTGYVDINPAITSVDTVNIINSNNNGSIIIDDVLIFKGTYLDGNDVPEIEKPEHKDDYNIVMLTCDMWREGHHFGNDSLSPFDNRTLALGYHSEGNPETCDWETKWMVEHGITVFAPCWYMPSDGAYAPKYPRNSARLDEGFMNSKFQDEIDFALNLTYSGVGNGEENFLSNMVPYWIERYFRHPSYWKIDNKPVLINYNTSEYTNNFGIDGTKKVLEKINQMCIEAGFDGVIMIGKSGVTDKEGYEYTYRYGMGHSDKGFSSVAAAENRMGGNIPYIYSVSQGWGEEAWGRVNRKLNVPLNEWKASLEYARDVYMPSWNGEGLSANTIVLDNWNEYCEGHFLAPSDLAGFGYLDMVREVFTTGTKEHSDLVPTEKYDQMSAQLW